MEATIKDCKSTFQLGYEEFEDSRIESREVWNMYHNRHWSTEEEYVLESRGQPKETFNVIKLYARMLVGYYSTVVNTVVVRPRNPRDVTTSTVLNDTINYVFEQNRFDIEGDQMKLGGLISGLLCSYTEVFDTGAVDQFGRPINEVKLHHVPDYELVLDPMSTADDYSDARFLHRFKWMTKEDVIKYFGKKHQESLDAYSNFLSQEDTEFDRTARSADYRNHAYSTGRNGNYRVHDNYLIVHTVIEDSDGKRWSIYWAGDTELLKTEITGRATKWPYRVQKLHSSDVKEYYGIFREVVESQKAINQAIIQIQMMANTTKVFVQTDAVTNIEEFQTLVNRVNAVIPVEQLNGIRVEKLSSEVMEQYTIIDKAFSRIQQVLGINDSFLGMAFASDSGRKVKLQQNQTVMSLRYLTARIEAFYTSLALDTAKLVQQFYRANQFLRITDAMTGMRWAEINKPMMMPTGEVDPQTGEPVMQPIMLEVINPDDGEAMIDEEGNILLAPIPEEGTDFEFTSFDIKIEASSYNDEDEKGQLMLESVMSGQIGQMLAQVNPAGFFKTASLALKTMGTKYSPQISDILDQTAGMLSQDPNANQEASNMAQGNGGQAQQTPQSKSLKLPQNTNEGL